MESFDFSLHKVNLEEKDIEDSDALNAFSDIYCYDSDFQSGANSLPVLGKKLVNKGKTKSTHDNLIDMIYASNEEYYTKGSGRAGSHAYRLPESLQHNITPPAEGAESSPAETRAGSLRAFTDTVDALALQTSVIGSASPKPASAEEVARVIAETQQKLLRNNQTVVATDSTPKADDIPGNNILPTINSSFATEEVSSQPANNDSNGLEKCLNGELKSHSTTPVDNVVPKHENTPKIRKISSAGSDKSSPRGAKKEDLIPIPKNNITTSVQKHKSWFISRAACSNSKISSEMKGDLHVVGDDSEPEVEMGDNEESYTTSSKDKGNNNTSNNNTHSPNGQHSNDGQSNDHVSPKHVGIVDEKVNIDENVPLPADVTPMFAKEPEVVAELSLPMTSTNTDSVASGSGSDKSAVDRNHTSTTHSATSGQVLHEDQNESVATFIGESVLSLTGDNRLRKQIDVLMKARAKLEGQLEVMAVESKTALQQRATLQAQVATLQQQLKSQEVVVTTATSEREALSSDMKTMKETRGRLEQVIVDAQKIIEDKDQDLKTLDEDVKLAKQANENLQTKLTEVKREMQAKSSTAEDLKNKIAELYVQFETTNQVKILLENEIKSVRSELRTLSTAKEWYQQQLQQAQNAKHQLQREATQIKGELISKSTMIERLKADNVRLKQHVTDTQQRIIQEKQLLAQHLEAIEADMLEREAAFAQIQRERDALQDMLRKSGHNPTLALQQLSSSDSVMTSDSSELTNELDVRRLHNDVKRKQAHIAVLEHEQAELMKRLALSQESILDRDKGLESLEEKYVEVQVEVKKFQQELEFSKEAASKSNQELNLITVELTAVKDEKRSFDTVIQNLKQDMTKVESSFHRIKQELAKKTGELHQAKLEKEMTNTALASQQTSATESVTVTSSSVESDAESTQILDNDLQFLKSQNSQLLQQIEEINKHTDSTIETLRAEKTELGRQLELSSQVKHGGNAPRDLFQQTVQEVNELMAELGSAKSDKEGISAAITVQDLVQARDESHVMSEVIDENCALKMSVMKLLQQQQQQQQQQHFIQESATKEKEVFDDGKNLLETKCKQLEDQLTAQEVTSSTEKSDLSSKIKELEEEVDQLKTEMATSDENRIFSLTLDLEKERGKLAGVLQNYEQLKTHTGVLESLIASKESSSVQLTSQAQQDMMTRERDIDELQANIHKLQTDLNTERSVAKDIKKQLMSEKAGNVKSRRKLENLLIDHGQMRVDYENKMKEMEDMRIVLEKVKDAETRYRSEYDRLLNEIQQYKVEIERLQREVNEQQAKDPVLSHQIKTLEWQVEEKNQELFASSQQLKLVEDRQMVEVNSLHKTMQGNTTELTNLREQLSASKQDRNCLQARIVQLKTALQSTMDAAKAGSSLNIDLTAMEELLKQTSSPLHQSRPLSFLQATLSDLRGDISTLQNQMDEHTTTLQSSSQVWKELVQDLQEVCKSTAAERAASESLLFGAAHAAASSPIAMATQAAARSQSNIAFIPPLTVQLPPNVDFTLPPDVAQVDQIVDTSNESVALEKVIDTGSSRSSSKMNTPERRLNTKAMPLNSIYAPNS